MILTFVSHQAEFLWAPRGFSSADEMNEAIIERWNSVVKPDDIVFHLGDITLTDTAKGLECFKRLNGQISVVWGNHDTLARQELIEEMPVVTLGYAHQFKFGKISCYLSHYPTLTANWDDKHFNQHLINFHGHTHQQKNWLHADNPFMYHVGLDSHDCYPVHIETAITEIRNRWEEIGRLNITPLEEFYEAE